MMGKSFYYFRPNHPVRQLMHKIALNPWFVATVDLMILVACVLLAIETPTTSEHIKRRLRICDYVFTSVFVLEMIMKMIALAVLPTRIFYDHDWYEVTGNLGSLELQNMERECGQVVKQMKREDEEGITVYDIQPNVIFKVVQSNDGWRVVLFHKSQDLRLVFFENVFHTAYLSVTDHNGRHMWVQWGKQDGTDEVKFGNRIHRMDVKAVCTSVYCDCLNHNSYFSSNWNLLDFLVVLFSVLGLMFERLTIFRVLRAIRPLRIAIRIQTVKIVLSALVQAIPAMASTLAFVCLVWFVVAILGTYFLSGKMSSCGCAEEEIVCLDWVAEMTEATCSGYDDFFVWASNQCACLVETFSCETMLEAVKTKSDCIAHPEYFAWANTLWHFDHVFASIHTLFVMATLSGWAGTMYEGINAVGVDQQPQDWHNKWLGIYFVIAIIICSFFSLNLIVSVVIDNFNRIKAQKNGSAFLTEKQQQWVKTQELSSTVALTMEIVPPPEDTIYMSIFNVVQNKYFEPFILGCILVNVSLMCTVHYDMSDSYTDFLYWMDLIFIIIFTAEAALKLTAYGTRVYFNDDWNTFDFVIVVCGIISLMEFISIGLNVIRMFRFFRIGRALRLINKAQKLKTLFLTLLYSIPALWNIGALIFVIMFIYAVIGVATFGEDVCDGECAEENDDVATKVNFTNFFLSMNLLYRVSTEDGWTDLYGIFVELHGEDWEVYVYFTTFFIFGTLVLWNLFIAVILDRFDENKELISIQSHIFSLFSWRDEWKKFDPKATGKITAEEFVTTVLNAEAPAGFDGATPGVSLPQEDLIKYLHKLRMVTRDSAKNEEFSDVFDWIEWAARYFCTWSDDSPEAGGWVVEWDEAIIALTNKIMREQAENDVPLALDVDEDEQLIVDWYCRNNTNLQKILAKIREEDGFDDFGEESGGGPDIDGSGKENTSDHENIEVGGDMEKQEHHRSPRDKRNNSKDMSDVRDPAAGSPVQSSNESEKGAQLSPHERMFKKRLQALDHERTVE